MRRFAGEPASALSISSHEQVDDLLGRKDQGIGIGEFFATLCLHAGYEGFQGTDCRHVIVGVRVGKGFIDASSLASKLLEIPFCRFKSTTSAMRVAISSTGSATRAIQLMAIKRVGSAISARGVHPNCTA